MADQPSCQSSHISPPLNRRKKGTAGTLPLGNIKLPEYAIPLSVRPCSKMTDGDISEIRWCQKDQIFDASSDFQVEQILKAN